MESQEEVKEGAKSDTAAGVDDPPGTGQGERAKDGESPVPVAGVDVVSTSPEEAKPINTEEGPASPPLEDSGQVDEPSIIEMEVDDSNTGDTITSNPEIDLGSAAAAATAVIIDEGDKTEDDIVIISTESRAPVVNTPEKSKVVTSTPSSPNNVSDDTDKTVGEKASEEMNEGNVIITQAENTSLSLKEDDEQQDIFLDAEGMEAGDENETETTIIITGTNTVTSEISKGISGIEIKHEEPKLNKRQPIRAFELDQEGLDSEFLHEEDSMSPLREDAIEIEKDSSMGERGLIIIGDDENDDDDETYLEITRRRISQDREGNCYCGKDRNFNIPELLCASCYRWYHESCISYQLGKLVPFTTNYVFTCKNCSPTGLECFRRNQAQFSQMCVTALANLTQASVKEGTNLKLFSKDRDIIPFFDMHWEALTTTTRRSTQSWHLTVTKTLMKDAGVVYSCQEIPDDPFSPYFGLVSDDLTQIRPNYEAMIEAGQLKITDQRNSSSLRGRGAKRRPFMDPSNVVQNTNNNKKPRIDGFGPKPVIGHGYPTEHPFNKDSYRYILAEPDPNAPFRQEFDESNEWSGKPIHGWLCRVVNPSSVLLALHDRAPQLRVSEDRLSVTGDKGYCMIRATHGLTRGSWYFEAKITDMPEGSATRIGFSQQFGNLQGPLGFDRFGYSWRSRYGTAFHEARGKSYAKGGYGLDDVLGFLIVLPDDKDVPLAPMSFKDRPLVKVKSHLYYEDKDDPNDLDKRELRGNSKIICFKNGVCQGVAFENLYCGTYYPAISLYKSITVRVNFGPEFEAPPTDHEYRGVCERAEDSVIEQTMADLLYLTENEGKLRLENAVPMPL